MSNLIDVMLNALYYKGRPGEVYFTDDDDTGVADLIVRGDAGYIVVPFKMENIHLGKRILSTGQIERSIILSIFSQAVMQHMRPVGILINQKVHSPYTHELLDSTVLWPERTSNATGGQLLDVKACNAIAQATGKRYTEVDRDEAERRSRGFRDPISIH